MLVTMDIHIRLLGWIGLIVLVVSSATSFPQSESRSVLLLRRQTRQLECTSYSELQHRLSFDVMDLTRGTAEQLFQQGVITQADLRSAAIAMCSVLSSLLDRYRNTLESCPNADEVLANMHVFSGLCYENGTMTEFLYRLIDGFVTSNFAWESECSHQVGPVLRSCRSESLDPTIDMGKGPQAYRHIMIEQERCNSEGFDKNDVNACGDVESLKRLACFCDLMLTVGPGVTFRLSDFWTAG
ncbi:uncharacterized protein LOC110446323 [Mizuhopecten yessoensis]|uniref:Uncharacterized protein n=1 Tax=Mizuhopecten yessoensis TaxID=6573 RepID=A0A210QXT1_MIZYE|nr:uncharacterized protein LOC110446323 [Mizuhopecten yessoensis]OWF53558.1 hypothetical protein KP79_PYT13671 [Mizuhopecten yessoensis]